MCLTYEKKYRRPSMAWRASPNYSSRNGVPIGMIVCHYTTSNNVDGVISWLTNPQAQVSAHYVISREGNITQLVKDDYRAWHAYGNNVNSIGIEICAEQGQTMTKTQELVLRDLCKYLLSEYPTIDMVTGHRFLYKEHYTDCPHSIFGSNDIDSLRVWVSRNLMDDFPRLKLPK